MNSNYRKRLAAGLFILTLLLLCVSCAAPKAQTDQSDDSLQKVLEKKELVLGLDDHFPPMGFIDDSGEITGFDVKTAEEVCKRLGVTLVKKPINWDEKENELSEGRIDCIWNGLSVNPARAEMWNLSEPYMINEIVFVVARNSGIKSAGELYGKRVGIQKGSSAEDVFAASELSGGCELTVLDNNVELLEQMELGKLDSVLLDSVFVYYYIAENDKDYYLLPGALATEEFAVGFRKTDSALRDRVQEILKEMKTDGSLAKLSTKWFGMDITTVK
ncbi:MAG: amino acid ABC transporter substrate-binding protein [Lachnospiraceae bacterium]|nr:amino acid ABC transporter substrate-binding protein [Lachnospiraceae bacterium]